MEYQEMVQRHRERVNEFPMKFAFSPSQAREALAELGCTARECTRFHGGMIIRKKDRQKLDRLFAEMDAEMSAAMSDDRFLREAIEYELANHEFCYTMSQRETAEALNLDLSDKRTQRLFNIAEHNYMAEMIESEQI